jgi:chromosome segregation ATPase
MNQDLTKLYILPDDLDSKSYQILIKEMAQKSSSGFDYLKFKQSVNALLKLNMDENMAIKSSFMTASTVGLTKEKLKKTADESIEVLMNEKNQFTKALEKQVKERIDLRQSEAQQFQEKIQKHQHQIELLKKEIEQFEERIASTNNEIDESKQRILQSRNKFEAVYEFLVAEIEKDKAKFDTLI